MTSHPTGNEPLATRARQRKAELEVALADAASGNKPERDDIERALLGLALLLTGASDPLAEATAVELKLWLERTRDLGVATPMI